MSSLKSVSRAARLGVVAVVNVLFPATTFMMVLMLLLVALLVLAVGNSNGVSQAMLPLSAAGKLHLIRDYNYGGPRSAGHWLHDQQYDDHQPQATIVGAAYFGIPRKLSTSVNDVQPLAAVTRVAAAANEAGNAITPNNQQAFLSAVEGMGLDPTATKCNSDTLFNIEMGPDGFFCNEQGEVIFIQFSGLDTSLPPSLFSFTALRVLNLTSNTITGGIPEAISNLTAMETLIMRNSKLDGSIPSGLGQLTNLGQLSLNNNNLTGTLPNLSNLTALGLLELPGNQLSGSLPDWIGKLTRLNTLDLSNTGLNGTLPTSLASLDLTKIELPKTAVCPATYQACVTGIRKERAFCKSRCAPYCTTCNLNGPPPSPPRPPPSPPPSPPPPPPSPPLPKASPGVPIAAIIAISVVASVLLLLAVLLLFFISQPGPDKILWTSAGVRRIPLADIEAATDSFSETHLIGEGGSSLVYKGVSPSGVPWAVKRINSKDTKEMLREIQVICRVSHWNLIRLLGYCCTKSENVLVYELAEKGDLTSCIKSGELSLQQRLRIAAGAASALAYLHSLNLLHRDIKSDNILLTADLEAKLSDFGLVKETKNMDGTVSKIVGTPGYVDPSMDGQASTGTDVYSFGVVLLELLTGRPAIEIKDGVTLLLADVVRSALGKQRESSLVDPKILINPSPEVEQVWPELLSLGVKCVSDVSEERPKMQDIIVSLEKMEKFFRVDDLKAKSKSYLPVQEHVPLEQEMFSVSNELRLELNSEHLR